MKKQTKQLKDYPNLSNWTKNIVSGMIANGITSQSLTIEQLKTWRNCGLKSQCEILSKIFDIKCEPFNYNRKNSNLFEKIDFQNGSIAFKKKNP